MINLWIVNGRKIIEDMEKDGEGWNKAI